LCWEDLRSLTHGHENDGDDNNGNDNYCGGGGGCCDDCDGDDVGNGRCSCGSLGCDGGDDGSGCSSGGGCGCVNSILRCRPYMYGRSIHQTRINVEWCIVS